jgi:LacI family transcriptional regulator
MKDAAAAAGVPMGTVSNVLNRPDLVRRATRAKVEAVIAELGH